MNQDLIAHLIISVVLLATAGTLFLATSDPGAHNLALILVPLVAGYWIPNPQQQRAKSNATT